MNTIELTKKNLQNICLDCENVNTSKCIRAKCNVGFALNLVELMQENKSSVIEDGLQLIPKEDTKYYDTRMIARSIASVCKLCKECRGQNEPGIVKYLFRYYSTNKCLLAKLILLFYHYSISYLSMQRN